MARASHTWFAALTGTAALHLAAPLLAAPPAQAVTRIVRVTKSGATIVEHEGVRYRIEPGAQTTRAFWLDKKGALRHGDPVEVTQSPRGPVIEEGATRLLIHGDEVHLLQNRSDETDRFNHDIRFAQTSAASKAYDKKKRDDASGRKALPGPMLSANAHDFSKSVAERVLLQAELGKLKLDPFQLGTLLRKMRPGQLWNELAKGQVKVEDLDRALDERTALAYAALFGKSVDEMVQAFERRMQQTDALLRQRTSGDPNTAEAPTSQKPWRLIRAAGHGDDLGIFLSHTRTTVDSVTFHRLRLFLQRMALGQLLPSDRIGELLALELKRNVADQTFDIFLRLRGQTTELSIPIGVFFQ